MFDKPSMILDAYADWVSGPPKNLLVVPYISMHGSTRVLVEHFVAACAERGIRAEQLNLVQPDLGRLASLLVGGVYVALRRSDASQRLDTILGTPAGVPP